MRLNRLLAYHMLGTSMLIGCPALAQDSGNVPEAGAAVDSPDDPGTIIVTAQKRSERLRDVPVSITAATGDQLAKQGVVSIADLEKIAPGFTYRLSQYGTPVFSIRGIGFYDEQVAVSPTVTIYTDQVPLVYARMTEGAALDVERVEVLKGPQGTLFGQNATGGAVNYIANKPTDFFEAGFDATYGRFDQVDLGGFVSGPIASGLNARLAVRTEQRGDWQINTSRDDSAGQRDFLVGRLLLDWEASDRLKFSLNVNGWRNKSDIQVGQARAYLPVSPLAPTTPVTIETANFLSNYPYVTSNNNRLSDWDPDIDLQRDDKFYQVAGRMDLELSDSARLIAITSYSHLETYAFVDLDATSRFASRLPAIGHISAFSQELRLEGEAIDDRLKWVVGANYERDRTRELHGTQLQGSNSELGGVHFQDLNLSNNQNVRDIAGFGGVDFRLTDTVSIQASARYTDENRSFSGCMSDPGSPLGFRIVLGFLGIGPGDCITLGPTGQPGLYETDLNESNFSWRGSVNWKPSPDTLIYANVTRGYKAGAFGTIPAVSYTQLKPVSQESVTAYEIGLKTSLIDRAVDLTAAAFYYDYGNKQIQGYLLVPPFGNLPNLVNIPKSRLTGAELELVIRPADGLRVTMAGTYLDSKVQDSVLLASFFGNTVDARGEAFPATPKWQLQGDAEYNFPIGGDNSAFVGAGVSYRSATVSGFGSQSGPPGTEDYFSIPGYALLDLRAGIDFGDRYRVQVFGRNVTNTDYWTNVTHVYDTVSRVTGFPVTYGISLTARY